jgi:hypothetical protein
MFGWRGVDTGSFRRRWCGWVEGLQFLDDGGVLWIMASFRKKDIDCFARGVFFHKGADCVDCSLVKWGGLAICGIREPSRASTGESGFRFPSFELG